MSCSLDHNRNCLHFSTEVKPKLHPWFITGFTDGEGSWGLSISKDSARKMGYIISPKFTIGLHVNDLALLERIAAQFGVGNISIDSNNLIRWHVSSVKDLVNVIIF